MSSPKEQPELQVFKTVLYYSLVIIALPLLSFFFSKLFIFDGILGMKTVPSNVYAAIVSIIALHVALGAFIYRAYFSSRSKPDSKAD